MMHLRKKSKDLECAGDRCDEGRLKKSERKLWDEQCRRNVYSASKSFTSTAVGIAVKRRSVIPDEKTGGLF